MGRPQLTPYAKIASLVIELVASGERYPVRACAAIIGVPHDKLERRMEDLRSRGWLPPGPAINAPEWHEQARALLAARKREAALQVRARASKKRRERVERDLARAERKRSAEQARLEKLLIAEHLRRARLEHQAQVAEERARERETEREQRRLAREATWRTQEEWEVQFWDRVDIGGADECWPWLGRLNAEGYGAVSMHDGERDGRRYFRSLGAHRAAWLTLRGPIEPGLTLDHVCHNVELSCAGGRTCLHRRCCNPSHLDAVPIELNSARGRGGSNFRDRTHCANGHEFAVYGRWFKPAAEPYPHRVCDECIRISNDRATARRQAARA